MNGGRSLRAQALGAGLKALGASRLPQLAAPFARGLGAILMFHHVRPWVQRGFAPNRGLEITPAFLDATLETLKRRGYEIVSLDDVPERIASPRARPFAALTFDDGYRDNLDYALPVLERHDAPFTVNVTTGFADGSARLWWAELEEAVRALPRAPFEGRMLAAETDVEKARAFATIYWSLRSGSEERLLAEVATLAELARLNATAITRRLCMDWDEIAAMGRHPLCAVGVHTLTHPRLAKLDAVSARRELAESKAIIEARVGRPARHLAYPVGDATSAGARDFALAADLGFATGVTTRKGMIFAEHRRQLTALPRLSVNGEHQDRAVLELLLTGAPFLVWNRGRRIAA